MLTVRGRRKMANGLTLLNQLVLIVVGCIIGAGGYELYTRQQPPPPATADIDQNCGAGIDGYECRFFNRGPATGAICVEVQLTRSQDNDAYIKAATDKLIRTSALCSGVLVRGQDSKVEGRGYHSGATGESVSAREYCGLKLSTNPMSGCKVSAKITAETK